MAIACIFLPSWPLQLLARAHPEWAGLPIVVVAQERANAELLMLDARARALGLTDRMRLGAAQALVPSLRSGVVDEAALSAATEQVLDVLRSHSPRVEVADVGTFYADPTGLSSLYESASKWAETVHSDLVRLGHRVRVVVGFGRHRTRALAAASSKVATLVLEDEEEERARALALPLTSFGISPALREALAALAVHTGGELCRLPPLELAMRFGSEALALHHAVNESLGEPLSPSMPRAPFEETVEVDPPDEDVERLLFVMKAMIDRLLHRLEDEGEAATSLVLTLALDHAKAHVESLEPASPTRQAPLLVELVRLRLGRATLPARVTAITIRLEGLRTHGRQLDLLATPKKRDVEAAARAIARLHASFGPECTTRLVLRDAHLPEARFSWEKTSAIALPMPSIGNATPPLVRRVRARPEPLLSSLESLDLVALHGPHRIDGGWWVRQVARDYYFAETAKGTVLWLYRDGIRARWFVYGEVD